MGGSQAPQRTTTIKKKTAKRLRIDRDNEGIQQNDKKDAKDNNKDQK